MVAVPTDEGDDMADETAAQAAEDEHHHHPPSFQIQIDRVHYTVHEEEMTGAQLRLVPPSGIPADRDLWEVRPGEEDRLIGDTDVVKIRDGLRFFTAPRHINPGLGA
jgi:hypothetical protein